MMKWRVQRVLAALALVGFFVVFPVSGKALEQAGDSSSEVAAPATTIVAEGGAASLLFATMKVVGALSLVLGVMFVVAIWGRKMGLAGGGRAQGSLIRVLDTRMIAPKKYVSVIAAGKQVLVVGITDNSINLLTRLGEKDGLGGEEELLKSPAVPANATNVFATFLNKASETVKSVRNHANGS